MEAPASLTRRPAAFACLRDEIKNKTEARELHKTLTPGAKS